MDDWQRQLSTELMGGVSGGRRGSLLKLQFLHRRKSQENVLVTVWHARPRLQLQLQSLPSATKCSNEFPSRQLGNNPQKKSKKKKNKIEEKQLKCTYEGCLGFGGRRTRTHNHNCAPETAPAPLPHPLQLVDCVHPNRTPRSTVSSYPFFLSNCWACIRIPVNFFLSSLAWLCARLVFLLDICPSFIFFFFLEFSLAFNLSICCVDFFLCLLMSSESCQTRWQLLILAFRWLAF